MYALELRFRKEEILRADLSAYSILPRIESRQIPLIGVPAKEIPVVPNDPVPFGIHPKWMPEKISKTNASIIRILPAMPATKKLKTLKRAFSRERLFFPKITKFF